MQAGNPWLETEIQRVKPKVILALGVTAGTALYRRLVNIQKEQAILNHDSLYAPKLLISWHPSAILRAPTEDEKRHRYSELKNDVILVWAESHC